MNNNDWTALLDKIPPELRTPIVQHAIEAQTSVMAASTAILERFEAKLDTANDERQAMRQVLARIEAKQDLIAQHLMRQDARLTKIEQRLDKVEADLHRLDKGSA